MTPVHNALDAQKHLQEMFGHELAKHLPEARISLRRAIAALWMFDEDMVKEMVKEMGYKGADFDCAAVSQYRYDNREYFND